MSKSGARNRKNTTKKSLDDDDDDDFSFDENEDLDDLEDDGESKILIPQRFRSGQRRHESGKVAKRKRV